MSLSRGIGDPLSPLGKDSAFVKTQNCIRLRSRHFLGFTQALAFPTGNNGSYISLGRNTIHPKCIACFICEQ